MKKLFPLILAMILIFSNSCPGYAAAGNAEELYADGMRYYDAAEYEHAFSCFLISGEVKGYSPAQYMLGICYSNGLGIEQNIKEAERCFRLSAEQGYEPAQVNLDVLEKARNDAGNIQGKTTTQNEAFLRLVHSSTGTSRIFTDEKIGVGRYSFNDLHLTNMYVSRVHAQLIFLQNLGWFVSDLGSTNGTFLNGDELTPLLFYTLHEGDLIDFAGVEEFKVSFLP